MSITTPRSRLRKQYFRSTVIRYSRCYRPDNRASQPCVRFGVVRDDEHFNLLTLAVTGAAVRGQVEAFQHAPPVMQPSVADLRRLVTADEFAGRSALVVGGSRGLGELTAKLLALGDAAVTITYAMGDSGGRGSGRGDPHLGRRL